MDSIPTPYHVLAAQDSPDNGTITEAEKVRESAQHGIKDAIAAPQAAIDGSQARAAGEARDRGARRLDDDGG